MGLGKKVVGFYFSRENELGGGEKRCGNRVGSGEGESGCPSIFMGMSGAASVWVLV